MKLTIKTLKGGKFTVEVEPSNTVAEAKGIIEAAKSELPAANMKLIHSGKVLKDADTIESCNINAATDFLVVMITKAKKAAPAAAPPAAAPAASTASAPAPAASSTSTSTSTDSSAAAATAAAPAASASTESSTESAPAPAPAAAAPAAAAPAAAADADADEFPAEMVSNLTSMGFPEAEVKACLRASGGNPDVAVEFLMNGIPPGVAEAAAARASGAAPAAAAAGVPASGGGGGGAPLAALRSHPQFDALRRLVQNNPQTLQSVLTQIGQQDPQLLQEINDNQAAFLEMMNEPVAAAPAPPPPGGGAAPAAGGAGGGGGGGGGGMEGLLQGMQNPAQMGQMLQAMSAEERQAMAAMMGLSAEQLEATAQMIAQMPPEQFQQYMQMAMASGGGMPGGAGGGGGGGGPGGPMAIRLTEEEMAAVDRLADMGFDRAEAAQAYLACDKNEALAANLLMDGGFGFADDGGAGAGGGGGAGGAPPGGSGGGDGDDMYD